MSMQNELSEKKRVTSKFSRGCNKIAIDFLELMKAYQFGYTDMNNTII